MCVCVRVCVCFFFSTEGGNISFFWLCVCAPAPGKQTDRHRKYVVPISFIGKDLVAAAFQLLNLWISSNKIYGIKISIEQHWGWSRSHNYESSSITTSVESFPALTGIVSDSFFGVFRRRCVRSVVCDSQEEWSPQNNTGSDQKTPTKIDLWSSFALLCGDSDW